MDDQTLHETTEAKLGLLARLDEQIRQLELEKDRDISEVVERYAPQLDPKIQARDELMSELADIFNEHEPQLTRGHGQRAVFRSGTLEARTSPGSLVIDDETKVISWLRRHGMLKAFTRIGKRTVEKKKLKDRPDLVAKIPGAHIERPRRLTVRLARTRVELTRDLHPYRTDL